MFGKYILLLLLLYIYVCVCDVDVCCVEAIDVCHCFRTSQEDRRLMSLERVMARPGLASFTLTLQGLPFVFIQHGKLENPVVVDDFPMKHL